MTTTTRFDEIALRSRRNRVRDFAFVALLSAFAAFSVTSVRAATKTAQSAPSHTIQTADMATAGSVCDSVIC